MYVGFLYIYEFVYAYICTYTLEEIEKKDSGRVPEMEYP